MLLFIYLLTYLLTYLLIFYLLSEWNWDSQSNDVSIVEYCCIVL